MPILTQQTLQGPWNPDFEMRTEENRFFSLPALNLSLSYLQVFGGFPMHGHFPGACRGVSGGDERDTGARCSCANMSKASLAAAAQVLTCFTSFTSTVSY